MDFLMILILVVSFGLVCLFAHWCDLQIKPKRVNKRTEVL